MASSTMEESKLSGGYLVTPRVPQGLAAAVEGLTREVIRHSPEDIYVFAAHHFEKLLLLRDRCGPEDTATNRDSNFRTLQEMSQALRMRQVDRENTRSTRNPSDQVGWSLNQTAKVLKRHRSIFGDAGRRISTDEVFQMANKKENYARTPKSSAERIQNQSSLQRREGSRLDEKPSSQPSDELWKASTSRTDRSWSNEDSPESSETKSGPRIITQIPTLQSSTSLLAKDIKTELRKNRISSRERRNVRAKPEDRSSIDQSNVKQSGKASGRNVPSRKSSERLRRTETEVEKRNRRSVESPKSSSRDRQHSQRTPESRAMSMDKVKDYVVQRFATTKSLEELQDLNYVEKVQEIIDETGPIIKGKVEELRSGMIGRSKRSSWFSDPRNDRVKGSNGSESDNQSSAGNSSYRDSMENSEALKQSADALKHKLTETQHLLANISSKMTRPRRSRSARTFRNSGANAIPSNIETLNRENELEGRLSKTKHLLEDISSALSGPMRRSSSAKSLRRHEDDDLSDLGSKDALKTRLDETRILLKGISATFAMPGHRVRSSKERRRRRAIENLVSEEMSLSDSQNVSKVSLPAVRSASAKSSSGSVSRNDSDNLVLPAISPEAPKSKKVKEDLVLPALSPSGTGSSNDGSKNGEDDVFAEEDIPEIPVDDYIPEAIVEDVFRDSLNVTPDFDNIPQRPDSLEPLETTEDTVKLDNLEERLQEIQKAEKDIEKVFTMTPDDREYAKELGDSGMKKKLQELEEAEKRIERIFDSDVNKEPEDSPKSEMGGDASVDDVDESSESGSNVEKEIVNEKSSARRSEEENEEDEEMKDDKQETRNLLSHSPEPLEYTYVLTEGSPYEIPDTVTTVIIPERTVESPESDRLDVVLEDDEEAKLTLVSGDVRKEMKDVIGIDEKVINEIDENVVEETDHDEMEKKSPSISPKNSSNEDDSSLKKDTNPFGELVEPEPIELTCPDIDFIRGIESRQEIHISHQDLGRITEEMSEELEEGLEDTKKITESPNGSISHKDGEDDEETKAEIIETVEETKNDDIKNVEVVETVKTPEIIEFIKETKEEVAGSSNNSIFQEETEDDEEQKLEICETVETSKTIEAMGETKEEDAEEVAETEDNGMQMSDADKTKTKTESELSPFGQNLDSSSSNEAKESSGPDEPLESAKCGNSADEEESSDTRSPESTNEVKETTLTDGLSLSLDPTRPFVPELNLDSLQDITVSSFKMTEDEYENQGHVESANTNSITETLTSDENHRIIESDLPEETVMQHLVSSSERSNLKEAEVSQVEVAEEPIVKSQVKIKEDICIERSAYVTGPDNEKNNDAEVQQQSQSEENDESGKSDSAKNSTGDGNEEIEEENKVEEITTTVQEKNNVAEGQQQSQSEEKDESGKSDSAKKSTGDGNEEIEEENKVEEITTTVQEKNNVAEVRQQSQSEENDESGKSDSAKNSTGDGNEEIEEENKVEEITTTIQEKNNVAEVQQQSQSEENDESGKSDSAKNSTGDGNEEIEEENKLEEITTTIQEKIENVVDEESVHEEIVEEKGDITKVSQDDEKEEIVEEEKIEQESSIELNKIDVLVDEEVQHEKVSEVKEDSVKSPIVDEKKEIQVDIDEEDERVKLEEKSLSDLAIMEDLPVENKENRQVSVEKNRQVSIEENIQLPVEENQQVSIEENQQVLEEENRQVSVEENQQVSVEENQQVSVEENQQVSVEENQQISVEENQQVSVHENRQILVEENRQVSEIKGNDEEIKKEKLYTTEDKDDGSLEQKSDAESVTHRAKKNEETKVVNDESLISAIGGDVEVVNHKMEEQTIQSANFSCEDKSVEEGSDEILEESFVEEETPLAVSRSASQCTTRRVSSGNLARLREDPTFAWTEESEREIGNEEEGSSSKLKFSKIGNRTIKEQSSDEIDQSQNSGSPKNISDDANSDLTNENKEYHIYVPEVDASDDNSTTESSTVDSAVTKIQARVRGFLTRRRMHRCLQNRSSTLSSIPSIQDSIVGETYHFEGHQPGAKRDSTETAEKTNISSSLTLNESGLENAATKIQSNYRRYQMRNRLRREDAVQRTTLSLEKSFAESGLQHTGEFHDCIPLPLHDIVPKKKSSNCSSNQSASRPQKSLSSSLEDKEMTSGSKNTKDIQKGHETIQTNPEDHQNHGQMFFGQPPNIPVIQFGMIPNISHLVDLVVLTKEESALENSYLNFITSVEDTEVIESNPEVETSGQNYSSKILKRPPAFSDPPVGVIIEEITSSEIESFLNNHSTESEIKGPEVMTESSGSFKAPCASSETISDSLEHPKVEEIVPEEPKTEETLQSLKLSCRDEENLFVSEEQMMKNLGISASFSSSQEKDLLGPESSVDSMECPVVGAEEKNASRGYGNNVEEAKNEGKVGGGSEDEIIIGCRRDSSSGSDVIKENTNEEEPFVSNVDDVSSTLSFSLKVEDILGVGSEDFTELHGRKPILEVTLTPGDIMKSMSLSQESQLAGERMESPITMVQMAPARSESLQLEGSLESGCEEEGNIGKAASPSLDKSALS